MHDNTLCSIIIQQLSATVTGKRYKIGMMVLIEDFPSHEFFVRVVFVTFLPILLLLRNTGNELPVPPGMPTLPAGNELPLPPGSPIDGIRHFLSIRLLRTSWPSATGNQLPVSPTPPRVTRVTHPPQLPGSPVLQKAA